MESGNDLPDILDEVKTGLNWLLKMQRDDGSVYHKISSELDFAYGYGPDEDPFERNYQAKHNFQPSMRLILQQLQQKLLFFFANRQPFCPPVQRGCPEVVAIGTGVPGIGQPDVSFPDVQSWQEKMWAKSEIYMLIGGQRILGSFYDDLATKPLSVPEWRQPQMLSLSDLYFFSGVSEVVKSRIQQKVEDFAAQFKTVADKSGYGSAIDKFGWGLGTNPLMANMGAAFACAHQITGNSDWLKYATQQLDYLLGRNSLNFSFVTGFGENKFKQSFHWISKTYGTVPAGFLAQGAIGAHLADHPGTDSYVKDLMEAGFPSVKIYVDIMNSRNSNEVGIYSMSSLAYLTGCLALHNRETEITNTPVLHNGAESDLIITDKYFTFFCANCVGKTMISLFSINGQLLKKRYVNAWHQETELLNYGRFIEKFPIILY